MSGSSAGRWVHIYRILFNAFKAFYFKSSAEFGNLYTASKWEGTSKSAIDLAWVPECPPIYPNVHAEAALIWSSGSFIKASFRG